MFMTGCVVLVLSSCHDKDIVKVSNQRYLKQCHICIQNVIIERMTLNDSCHKVGKVGLLSWDYLVFSNVVDLCCATFMLSV